MAQLDANIFLQQQGPDFNKLGEGFERGMRLGDMMRERKAKDLEMQKQQRIRDATQSAVITNPDGSKTLDTKMAVGKIMQFDPVLGRQKDAEFQQQDLIKEQNRNRAMFTEALKAKQDPSYYQTAVNNLVAAGHIKREEAPPVFDEGFVNTVAAMTGTPADYLENQRKIKEEKNKTAIEWAKIGAAKEKNDLNGPKISDGQKMLDKEFAKDLNEFSGGGEGRLQTEIAKIDGVVERLRNGKGTTGGATGLFGDRLTSNDVLKNRSDVKQSAMSLIKTLLTGATSDKDREDIVNTLWNEADSTENNIARLERFAGDMRERLSDNKEKAKYFENSGGTLYGYKSQGAVPIKKEDMPPTQPGQKPQTLMQNGFIYKLNPQTGKYE